MNKAYDVKKVDWFYCKLIMFLQMWITPTEVTIAVTAGIIVIYCQ